MYHSDEYTKAYRFHSALEQTSVTLFLRYDMMLHYSPLPGVGSLFPGPPPCVSGGLTLQERKLTAVATKLVTCPALLLVDQPLGQFCHPRHSAAAQHLLGSLMVAASQLHINVIIAEEALQSPAFDRVHNVVMLDEQARTVYAGPPDKVNTLNPPVQSSTGTAGIRIGNEKTCLFRIVEPLVGYTRICYAGYSVYMACRYNMPCQDMSNMATCLPACLMTGVKLDASSGCVMSYRLLPPVLQAVPWFRYLGFTPDPTSPSSFCNSVLLGDSISTHRQDAVQQHALHALWAEQGQAWQLCPPPRTPPSPIHASAAHYKKVSGPGAGQPAALGEGRGQGMSAAPISTDWANQNSPAVTVASDATGRNDLQSYTPPVPVLHLPTRARSGNPFASIPTSLDSTAQSAPGLAAEAEPAATGALVPPLALHRIPAPFGNALGHSPQPMQSRLGLESNMVVASSFTSASLSYSDMPSTGYSTRSHSPVAGLKSHFLHASVPNQDEFGDAVSNPLFGCTPKRGSSPGMSCC